MPEMNKPSTSIPHTSINPVASLSKALDRGGKSMGQQAVSRFQVRAAVHMQGQQHEHEKVMQAGQHAHEQNLALIGGATDMEVAKIQGRAAVHVARAQGASQVDIAKVQADAALKQQAAGHRHEIKLGIQQHHQDLEKQAQTHHETIQRSMVDSLNKRAEQQQADEHAQNATTRAISFMDAIKQHAEPGTKIDLSHGDARTSFTAKKETPAPAPAAPAAETPKAEEPKQEAPAPTQRYAHRDPVTNKITHYEDKPQVLKPAKKTKKAAPKKKK